MTYDKEFEDFVDTTRLDPSWTIKDRLWFVWQAARKDHYRIGEEVEVRFSPDEEYEPAAICASSRNNNGGYLSCTPSNVRRIPEKTRIHEIAEEAFFSMCDTTRTDDDVIDIIKYAILQARKEWEDER